MNKTKFIIIILICSSFSAKSQKGGIKKDSLYFKPVYKDQSAAWDSMNRANMPHYTIDSGALKIAKTINSMDLKKTLFKIASEEFQGRETGHKGQKLAENYISNQFKSFGLKPAGDNGTYVQNFEVIEDTLAQIDIETNSKKYIHLKDYYSYLRLNHSDSLQTDKIYFAGYGIDAPEYSNYKGKDMTGQVVMICTGEPKLNDSTYLIGGGNNPSSWSSSWDLKLKTATKMGAASILIVIDGSIEDEVNSNLRITAEPMHLATDTLTRKHFSNVYYISKSMASTIFEQAGKNYDNTIKKMERKQKPVNEKLKVKTLIVYKKMGVPLTSSNVAGIVEGTDKKNEVVIITAHYDHLGMHNGQIYYGADDDGSGTTAVLELAKTFSRAEKLGYKPHRTILFMCFSGEEKGLIGSEYYCRHPLLPLENTVVDLNIDMIGRLDTAHERTQVQNYVYIIGDNKLSSELRPISEKANNTYLNMELNYKYNNDSDPNHFYSRSDHYNFAKRGIPVIFYFNGNHEDYHKPTDVVNKINFSKLYLTTELVFYTAWDIANREKRIMPDKK